MPHKIVSYGGAFTPPTIGHKAIIDGLLERGIAKKVLIIPSGPRVDKVYAYSDSIRRRLLEVFASEFPSGSVELDTTWMDGKWETTTLGMDDVLTERYGYSIPQVFWADVIESMPTWDYDENQKNRLLLRLPKIFLSRNGVEMKLDGLGSYEVYDLDVPSASSTLVREQGRVDLLSEKVRAEYLMLTSR